MVKMPHFHKITVRQRKIARKRVFAEFVSSCLASNHHESNTANDRLSPQAVCVSSCLASNHHESNTANGVSPQDSIKSKSTKLDMPVKIKSLKTEKPYKRFRYDDDGTQSSPAAAMETPSWVCCDTNYSELLEIHKHVAKCHQSEIESLTDSRLDHETQDDSEEETISNEEDGTANSPKTSSTQREEKRNEAKINQHKSSGSSKTIYTNRTVLPWLPSMEECSRVTMEEDGMEKEGEILLYYKYVDVDDSMDVCEWQKELCRRLGLTGKIRIANEGMNGTVGGKRSATQYYIKALTAHPLFESTDIKTSKGSAADFPKGLQCGVHDEIVPMGIDPNTLSFNLAGGHLSADEFHDVLETHISTSSKKPDEKGDTVFVDCRNFYESRIGKFKGAIAPDIRKFSYWPEYIDQNVDRFRDKTVVMYCTGGIRCERGSAYLKSKGVCKDVLQLNGGIHRYMEKYPNGYFQGKLFVFDDRYSISTNDSVISGCFYCNTPWDQYQPCTSPHCHQLVLSCTECRQQGSTACCKLCKEIAHKAEVEGQRVREECECTRRRVRIPQETISSSKEIVGHSSSS